MKKSNKKGFTLTELIAVIVILAIIIAITIPTYGKIKSNIDRKNYENNIELIKTAALKYTENTNIKIMFVEDLINEGYLDKNISEIKDIDSGDYIKCYIIKITTDNGLSYASLIKNTKTEENGSCPFNIKNELNNDIYIDMKTISGKELESKNDYWTNEDITLTYVLRNQDLQDHISKIEWYRGLEKLNDTGESILVNNQELIQQLYTIKIIVTKDNKEIKYETSVYVRIDKEKPLITKDIYTPKNEEWSQSKTYQIKGNDNYSGLWGYNFINENENCSSNFDDYTKDDKYLFKENGTKKVCLIDYAGNIIEKIINVTTIDTSAPTCGDITGESTTWTNSNRTITQACSDTGGSGCNQETYVKTYASSTKTDTITIKDNAGNATQCTYNVYVDKIAPTCGTVTGASTTWTTSDRTITQACSDTGGSGCEKTSYSKTFSASNTPITTSTITIKDNAGNSTNCSVNVYVKKENKVICKRATSLHTEICNQTDSTYFCGGAGYTYGSTITYGNLGTKGVLGLGDAFDCDVNGDGIYNATTERFYYLTKNYNIETGNYEDDIALLIYYNNVSNGVASNTVSSAFSSNYSNIPNVARTHLPTTNQWSNVSLTDNSRNQIYYPNCAARLLTLNEFVNATSKNYLLVTGLLDDFPFLFENTKFSNPNYLYSYWLETQYNYQDNYNIFSEHRILGNCTRPNNWENGVRPVIEVSIYDMEY